MIRNFEKLIDDAISKCENMDIFTFAIYHDHESDFVSVCIDTKENSEKQLRKSNEFSMEQFQQLIDEGDLGSAMLWQANIGRNLSLGDFSAVNISELELGGVTTDDGFYLSMVRAIQNKANEVLQKSSHGSSLLFCCSTANEEVGLTWVQANA